jgi:DNA-binding CsgD family transcriptional regulator
VRDYDRSGLHPTASQKRPNVPDLSAYAYQPSFPLLPAIYRKLVACEEAGADLKRIGNLAAGNGWQLIRVSAGGGILDASADAIGLLRRYFGHDAIGRGSRLPAPLAEWFSRRRSWGLDRPAVSHGQRFTASRLGMKLIVQCLSDPLDACAGYLLMNCERLELRTDHLGELPLTTREREILVLVAAGKTNAEIGMILAISARTVQKHLEHIFQKLGVETRTAAAVFALAAADSHVATA